MEGVKIENSEQEQYLGDVIHEKGCKESITSTIKARIRKLISKTAEILRKCPVWDVPLNCMKHK